MDGKTRYFVTVYSTAVFLNPVLRDPKAVNPKPQNLKPVLFTCVSVVLNPKRFKPPQPHHRDTGVFENSDTGMQSVQLNTTTTQKGS